MSDMENMWTENNDGQYTNRAAVATVVSATVTKLFSHNTFSK